MTNQRSRQRQGSLQQLIDDTR